MTRHRMRLGSAQVLPALLLAGLLTGAPHTSASEAVSPVASTAETTPVLTAGDAADDPAIWLHPSDPSASLIVGNDKKSALETYNLDGTRVQRITTGTTFWGNVDVRGDLVATYNGGGVRVYRVDPSSRRLTLATDNGGIIPTGGEGLCLYQSPTQLYVFAVAHTGVVRQFLLTDADADGLLEGVKVRQLSIGSESEGCVADDANGALYVSEEDMALWRYVAEPTGGTDRSAVDTVATRGGHIAADAEGVTVAGSYLIVSAQNVADRSHSYFVVYDRTTNAYVKSFRVVAGESADDCDATDGITATAADLGPLFPSGVFVCQDGNNGTPGTTGNQDFKLVRWEAVAGA